MTPHNPLHSARERATAPIVFALALIACTVGCTPDGGQACNADEDCPAAQMCVDAECVAPIVSGVHFDGATNDIRLQRDTLDHPDTTPTTGEPYSFVRIDDLTTEWEPFEHRGADIDAVVLEKPTGTISFAKEVEGYAWGSGLVIGVEKYPWVAEGPPDAYYTYPDVSSCILDDDTVISLGGTSGMIIVEMASPVEPGDTLTVLEVGDCDLGGVTAISNSVWVGVSTRPDIDGPWLHVGSGEGAFTLTVPELP